MITFGNQTYYMHVMYNIQLLPSPEQWDLGQTLIPVKFWIFFHSVLRKRFDLGIAHTFVFVPHSSESLQKKIWAR